MLQEKVLHGIRVEVLKIQIQEKISTRKMLTWISK